MLEVSQYIAESIGYKNVTKALNTVFGLKVTIEKYVEIGTGEDDIEFRNDFSMLIKYRECNFVLEIGDTRMQGMMNSGNVGGRLGILIPDFTRLDGWAPYIDDNGTRYTYLKWRFPKKSKIWDFLTYEGQGRDLEAVTKSLQILKDYLNEQIRLENEEKDRNSFGF